MTLRLYNQLSVEKVHLLKEDIQSGASEMVITRVKLHEAHAQANRLEAAHAACSVLTGSNVQYEIQH